MQLLCRALGEQSDDLIGCDDDRCNCLTLVLDVVVVSNRPQRAAWPVSPLNLEAPISTNAQALTCTRPSLSLRDNQPFGSQADPQSTLS